MSYVYFIGSIGGPVKIGFSKDPRKRLGMIQTGHARRLQILALEPGAREDESRLHERFGSARMAGEWFRPVPELLIHIWSAASRMGGETPQGDDVIPASTRPDVSWPELRFREWMRHRAVTSDPWVKTPSLVLWHDYFEWSRLLGFSGTRMTRTMFGRSLRSLGHFAVKDSAGRMLRRGICLRDEDTACTVHNAQFEGVEQALPPPGGLRDMSVEARV